MNERAVSKYGRIPDDIRARILSALTAGRFTRKEVSEYFQVSVTAIQRIKRESDGQRKFSTIEEFERLKHDEK